MEFQKIETPLADLFVIEPKVFTDDRGFFFESYNERDFREAGIGYAWVQDNHARSVKNTLRGLHFQKGRGQAKLVRCTKGKIFDVAVDIRPASATFGRWHGVELSEENHRMLLIPEGFAHGYAVLTDIAESLYKCDSLYDPAIEDEFAWNDPDVGIEWPVADPILSERDRNAKPFRTLRKEIA